MSRREDGNLFPWDYGRQAVLFRGAPSNINTKKVLVPDELSIFGLDTTRNIYYNGPVPFIIGMDLQDTDYKIQYANGMLSLRGSKGDCIPNFPTYNPAQGGPLMKSLTQIALYKQRQDIRSFKEGEYDDLQYSYNLGGNKKDGSDAVNFIIYHFTPNWGIRKVYPINADFESVDVYDSREFRIQSPAMNTSDPTPPIQDTDIIKVVVFDGSNSFLQWEMPDLETEMDPHPPDDSRSVSECVSQRPPVMPDSRVSSCKQAQEDRDVQESQPNRWYVVQKSIQQICE